MRTKNKMKGYDAKSKELWEVTREYFTKELESNLAQHIANKRSFKYKLLIYQKKIPMFVYGNPSTDSSGQDEKTKVGPSGTTQEEEM
jgi:hypothetical protein